MANYYEYVNGSTARKIYDETVIRERDYEQIERSNQKKPVRRKKKINILYLGAVMIAIAISLYLCAGYVKVCANINATSINISNMERKIEQLKSANEVAYSEVDSAVDMSYVYKRATKKLGMIPASSNQVYSYDNKKSDRVIQYNKIPD